MRGLWRGKHENHQYSEYSPQWEYVLRLMACRMQLAPAALPLVAPLTPAPPAAYAVEPMQVD